MLARYPRLWGISPQKPKRRTSKGGCAATFRWVAASVYLGCAIRCESPPRAFAAGRKPEGANLRGCSSMLAQIWGEGAQEHGLCEFGGDLEASFAQRVGPLCAAGQARTSVSRWRAGEIEPPRAHECRMRGKNSGLGQGAIPHSERWLRGERWNCASRRGYPRAVASRMRRTRVRWLATKSPCRTVTWQAASPCTGIRLSPKCCRMLLRLSAELRRP